MGPMSSPPSETFEYSCPFARAAASVHWSAGASMLRLDVREMKFEPARMRMLRFAPLKPPTDTSYGEVTSDVVSAASRGVSEPLKFIPLRVVEFWSDVRPSTEKPEGSPSA